MFQRRYSGQQRVDVRLPRGRSVEVTIPRAPWRRPPERPFWARPQVGIAAGIAVAVALWRMAWQRRKQKVMEDLQSSSVATPGPTTAANGMPSATTPPRAPVTSDREPDEVSVDRSSPRTSPLR